MNSDYSINGACWSQPVFAAASVLAAWADTAAVVIAAQLGSPALAVSAHHAYLSGMPVVLATTAAVAAGSAVLTALLVPGRPVQTAERATADAATAP